MTSQLPLPATAVSPNDPTARTLFGMNRRRRNTKENNSDTLEPPGNSWAEKGPDATPISQDCPVTVTEADVLEAVNMHNGFKMPTVAPGIEVTDLPVLDDVTQYDVTEQKRENLWAKEVSRLVIAVTTDAPLELKGFHDSYMDSESSYEKLAYLADQFWETMNIALHDGENVLAEHSKAFCNGEVLKRSRMILDYLCNKEEDVEEDRDKVLRREVREDFFNFVDYCTAILARVICDAADGNSMHIKVLADLAKISTKIKVLSAKTQEFAQISIENGVADQVVPVPDQNGLRGRRGYNSMDKEPEKFPDTELDSDRLLRGLLAKIDRNSSQTEPSSKKESMRKMYFAQCAKFRGGIFSLLRVLIISLRGTNNLTRTSLTSYEICAMIYETGFERSRTLVFQDHNNDFLGTSDASYVNCARNAFHLLNQVVRHASSQVASKSRYNSDNDRISVGTRVYWNYIPEGRGSDSLKAPERLPLESIRHVVTVIVPLIMTNPLAVVAVAEFINFVIFADMPTERQHNPVKPRAYRKYSAFFCLTTEEYGVEQRRRGPNAAKSLSNALMRRNNLLAGKSIADIGRAESFAPDASTASYDAFENDRGTWQRIQRHQLEMDNARNKMKAWVSEEKGVMVRCRLYVFTSMLFCAALVTGGVSIGLTVGERVQGVDPFNITTYCWVFAAFLLLIARSIRVQDWPWNDFLHGRVLCKSVSELSSVTGIKDQLILAKLLEDDSTSYLKTRGPFNTVFKNRSKDGFSIDRPLSTWTMLLSGLIMVEVESARGRGLVCLDLRRGTQYGMIQNLGEYNSGDESKLIHCTRLVDEKDSEAYGDPNRVRLKFGNMVWIRAIGIYGNKHAAFE